MASGQRVPSVTTVISRFKESGGLVHWAWKLGMDGIDYRRQSEESMAAGTLTHALIEAHLLGRESAMSGSEEIMSLARRGFHAFRDWMAATRVRVLQTEVPLVSEDFRFGGTFDALAELGGELILLDWKTGNRIYTDHVVQASAYRQLWEEHHADQSIRHFHLLRVGKEFGDFHHHSWPSSVLDIAWRQFRLLRQAYDMDAPLKRAAGI